jgi:hypothetical protein
VGDQTGAQVCIRAGSVLCCGGGLLPGAIICESLCIEAFGSEFAERFVPKFAHCIEIAVIRIAQSQHRKEHGRQRPLCGVLALSTAQQHSTAHSRAQHMRTQHNECERASGAIVFRTAHRSRCTDHNGAFGLFGVVRRVTLTRRRADDYHQTLARQLIDLSERASHRIATSPAAQHTQHRRRDQEVDQARPECRRWRAESGTDLCSFR